MTRERMSTATVARIGIVVVLGAGATACAASAKSPARSSAESTAPSQQAYGQQPGGYPSGAQADATASPPPPPSTAPAQPQGGATSGPGTSRSIALQSATSEMETSQRELDVAAGDCRNACRALGSMDRAAGKVCELSHGDDDGRRCDDAKKRVYTSRDRVKTTCGQCPGGPSVERSAPVPSR